MLTGCSESGRYRVGTTLIESDLWSKYRADGLRRGNRIFVSTSSTSETGSNWGLIAPLVIAKLSKRSRGRNKPTLSTIHPLVKKRISTISLCDLHLFKKRIFLLYRNHLIEKPTLAPALAPFTSSKFHLENPPRLLVRQVVSNISEGRV